ncbi:hypothetical protein ACIBG8_22120 [Nonomuraea sp. NPDC050556]|uniref:hypothetical protein n=1 Tax=Nonomuraea sp. NPDC050556 TaxID=3364369 RepID=UPI003792D06E
MRVLTTAAGVLAAMSIMLASAPAAVAAPRVAWVSATPEHYSGACPVTVTFSAKIRGSGKVTYRWVRGDGSTRPLRRLRVRSSAVVTERQTFTRGTRGWQAIKVNGVTSKRAYFSVRCDRPEPRPVSVDAVIGSDREGWNDECPAAGVPITYTGRIDVSRPGVAVRWRWVSDQGAGDVRTAYIHGRSRTFTDVLYVKKSEEGWRQIEVLSPAHAISPKVTYKFVCKPPGPKVTSVKLNIQPTFTGPCPTGPPPYTPAQAPASFDVSVSDGPVTVKYTFVGPTVREVVFNGTGPQTQTVPLGSVIFEETRTYDYTLEIVSPEPRRQATASVKVTCT